MLRGPGSPYGVKDRATPLGAGNSFLVARGRRRAACQPSDAGLPG
jgi:hypothetical protein